MSINKAFLKGDRIYLRQLEESDVNENYYIWLNNKEICKGNSHARFPMSKESISQYVKELNDAREKLVLAVIEIKTDKQIGNISIQSIDYINRTGEFAILLGEKSAWGKGYGEEIGKLIIAHVFNNLDLRRIYCGTFSTNIGMQKLAIKLNFRQEGLRRKAIYKEGQYLDILEYGLLREEFNF